MARDEIKVIIGRGTDCVIIGGYVHIASDGTITRIKKS